MAYAVFLLSFTVYLTTLAPTVTYWDSGELILGAVSLGNPHPPAYPLFCSLGKAFSLIPIGSAAYRVNLLSAVFGAMTAYVLFRLVALMGGGRPGGRWLAASMALCFAFLRNFWGVAVVTEVYSLNTFLLACTACLMYMYFKGRRLAHLHASAFLLGLALVNHQSVLMTLPAYAAFLLLSDGNYKKPRVVLQLLFFFLLGYSVIIYLPIRASAAPLINIGDPRDLQDFGWSVRWPSYVETVRLLYQKVAGLMHGRRLAIAASLAAACAGALYAFRRRPFALTMGFSAVLNFLGIAVIVYGQEGARKWGLVGKFYVPAILFMVPVVAEAVYGVWDAMPRFRTAPLLRRAAFAILLTALPAGLLGYSFKAVDNSRNFFAYDFAGNTLKSFKPDAALFAWGDNGVFPAWYLQRFERYRDDVLFMHTELLTYRWYMADIQGEARRRYGVQLTAPARLTKLEANVPILKFELEKRTPTYFDYSAAYWLKVPWGRLKNQGIVYITPDRDAVPLERLWGRYVLRGAFDDSTNKAFAAEDTLAIYTWAILVWMRQAVKEGRLDEAVRAYDLGKGFNLFSPDTVKWMEGVKSRLKSGEGLSNSAQKW